MANAKVTFMCGHEGTLGYDPEYSETARGARAFAKHRPCRDCTPTWPVAVTPAATIFSGLPIHDATEETE